MVGQAIDKGQVLDDVGAEWLAGLEGAELEEGRRLLSELVDGWALEANATPDPAAVLRIQRRDLEERGRGQSPAGRLRVLRALVLGRRVERLGAKTYGLGKEILDGSVDDADARARGESYLRQAEELAAEVEMLGDGTEVDPIRRELGDAMMEALYAVERKAMSPRLARELPSGQPGPPSIF